MELFQLNYFKVLAELEHFTKASEALHITQPALSKAISNLEEELGVTLFDRSGKQIHLTSTGKMLLGMTEPILRQLDDLQYVMAEVRGGSKGRLDIACTFPMETSGILQSYTRSYIQENPGISIHSYVYSFEQVQTRVQNRKLDFGFTLAPPTVSGIDWDRLFGEKFGLMVCRSHPFAARESISLAECRGEHFYINIGSSDKQDTAIFLCSLAGFQPEISYEGNDTPFISQSVADGLGISLIARDKFYEYRETTRDSTWQEQLVFVPVSDAFCHRPIFILFPAGRYQSTAGLHYLAGLKQYVSRMVNECPDFFSDEYHPLMEYAAAKIMQQAQPASDL